MNAFESIESLFQKLFILTRTNYLEHGLNKGMLDCKYSRGGTNLSELGELSLDRTQSSRSETSIDSQESAVSTALVRCPLNIHFNVYFFLFKSLCTFRGKL